MQNNIDGMIYGQVSAAKESRSGIGKNNKPWTIFEVIINGEKLTTFDRQFLGEVGKPAQEYGYKFNNWTDKRGNQHSDRVLVELVRTAMPPSNSDTATTLSTTFGKPTAWSPELVEKIFESQRLLHAKIDKIGKMVAELAPAMEDDIAASIPPLQDEEIKPEEIPF